MFFLKTVSSLIDEVFGRGKGIPELVESSANCRKQNLTHPF
jgi:hypothetical protein